MKKILLTIMTLLSLCSIALASNIPYTLNEYVQNSAGDYNFNSTSTEYIKF